VRIVIRYGCYDDDIAVHKKTVAEEWTYLSTEYTVRESGKVTQFLVNTENTSADFRVDDAFVRLAPGDKPAPQKVMIEQPVYAEGCAIVGVTNKSGKAINVPVYAASYDETERLGSMGLTEKSVPSDGRRLEIKAGANNGDKIFVWDEQMRSYADTGILK